LVLRTHPLYYLLQVYCVQPCTQTLHSICENHQVSSLILQDSRDPISSQLPQFGIPSYSLPQTLTLSRTTSQLFHLHSTITSYHHTQETFLQYYLYFRAPSYLTLPDTFPLGTPPDTIPPVSTPRQFPTTYPPMYLPATVHYLRLLDTFLNSSSLLSQTSCYFLDTFLLPPHCYTPSNIFHYQTP
jgi:hypothetical protein